MIVRLVALILSFALVTQAHAAQLKVLASTAMKDALERLAPEFEKATGNMLVFTFGPAADLKKQIEGFAPFDVAILTPILTDDLATSGKLDAMSSVRIARVGSGVSVPAGQPKPDLSTVEALKDTLLKAKSIGFNGNGASRAGNEALLQKLGIANAVKSKVKLLDKPAPVAVGAGEVEVGLGPMSEIPLVPGVQVAGPYPASLQTYLIFSGSVSVASQDATAARTLLKFLISPAAAPAYRASLMEPASQ
jgi:molybdate transport system substrate-binding protein